MTGARATFPVIGEWTLRRATGADLDQLVALENEIFRNDAWPRDLWRAELQSAHTWYVVVVPTGAPADVLGYAGLLSLPRAHDGDVQTIGLSAELRGHGLGRELMRQLHGEARRRGLHEVFLDVRVDNPVAQTLYRSFGYEQIGVRKGYYQPDNVDALVMRLPLSGDEPVGRRAADAEQAAPARAPLSGDDPVGRRAADAEQAAPAREELQ